VCWPSWAPQAQACIERVLDVCRATPLINQVRQGHNGPLIYMFAEGNKQSKPIDLATIG
jgi:hypothetical protein